MLALRQANDALRAIPVDHSDRSARVATAMQESGLYNAREHLLVAASPEMVLVSEAVFRTLLEVRDAVARGLPLTWTDYRPATDGMAKAVWTLRRRARLEFDGSQLNLDQISAVQAADITDRIQRSNDPT